MRNAIKRLLALFGGDFRRASASNRRPAGRQILSVVMVAHSLGREKRVTGRGPRELKVESESAQHFSLLLLLASPQVNADPLH